MALPLNINESVPGDSDIVSQFPALERAFREDVEDFLFIEHGDTGRHEFDRGTTAARDAITNWEVGSIYFNTTTGTLQITTSIDPDVWAEAITGLAVSDLADGSACSVIGRSANSSGAYADISAGSNDTLLIRTSNALSFGQLTVGMIPNDTITYAKLQNVSDTDRILGRDTASAGDVEELTVTSPLAFTGTGGLTVSTATDSAAGAVELATPAETQARSSSTRAVTPSGLADFARIKTGTYTGDGSTSLAITGVGFTPKYVKIWPSRGTEGDADLFETTAEIMDDHANGGAWVHTDEGPHVFLTDKIIAFGADGFTVDDDGTDQHPNSAAVNYNYLCIG